jgi:hypothetical protein
MGARPRPQPASALRRRGPRIEPGIVAGYVECRQARVGILRQAAAPGFDEARLRPADAGGTAGLAQGDGAAQFARHRDERAVQGVMPLISPEAIAMLPP